MHASGLPRETPHGATEAAILAAVGKLPMLFPQFASTAYSNLGVSLLGRTLEKATGGLSWEDFVATKIMAPLGMSHSGPCIRTEAEANEERVRKNKAIQAALAAQPPPPA